MVVHWHISKVDIIGIFWLQMLSCAMATAELSVIDENNAELNLVTNHAETEARQKVGVTFAATIIAMSLHRLLANRSWNGVNLQHAAWIVPLLILFFANYGYFSVQDDSDVICSADLWTPMIPTIAELYLPAFGRGVEIKKSLLRYFGKAMFINVLNEDIPTRTLPSLNEDLMDDQTIEQRRFFFCTNYVGITVSVMVVLEILRKLVPLIVLVCTNFAELCAQKQLSDEKKYALLPSSSQKTETSGATAVEKNSPGLKIRSNTSLRFKLYTASFVAYYTAMQIGLYIWVDLAVAGGLLNVQTGVVFEMWTLVLLCELSVHGLTCIVVYTSAPQIKHQSPSLLVLPMLMPLVGNGIHLVKDHLSQGLSFVAARCSESVTLSWVGLCLGYAGFAATIVPIVALSRSAPCREGLRAAHWPVCEAGPATQAKHHMMSLAAHKERAMSGLIATCTQEKEVRALWGECPHTVLHILFIFFYGGSHFLWFSIFLSAAKIFYIPFMRTFVILRYIADWGCSKDCARKFLVNEGPANEAAQKAIFNLASDRGWIDVLEEFFDTVNQRYI